MKKLAVYIFIMLAFTHAALNVLPDANDYQKQVNSLHEQREKAAGLK